MAEIVASVLVESVEHTRVAAQRAAMAGADRVELRLDRWPVREPLDELIAAVSLPTIVSCRTLDEGGSFSGTLAERRELFERALGAGAAGIDLEAWETWSPREDCLVVRSHHDLRRVPADLDELRGQLLDAGDVAKIACFAPDLADAAPLFDLLASGDREREPTVAFALGERASA